MSKDKSTPVAAKRALASEAATGKRGRFSASRKAEAVLRLLRGEDLELLSRELGVVASTLSLWREQFLAAGQSSLKGKTGKTDERDEQISRLKKKVGELTMDTNAELHISNSHTIIQHKYIITTSHQLAIALLHDARQDQRLYIPYLSSWEMNVPEVSASLLLKHHSERASSRRFYVNHETSDQINQRPCVSFSIACG